MTNQNDLYKTNAINKDGVNGYAYVDREDGLSVVVSSPLNNRPGTNPEELLGLSLSTCFNSTIKAILKEKNLKNQSRVNVPVALRNEPEEVGYYFNVEVLAAIEGLSMEKAEEIVELARHRCPVFKLIQASQTVHLMTVPFE